jgi:hypothetical protein
MRLSKGYENGQEPAIHESGGGVSFIENLKKLAVGAVKLDRSDRSTIPVRPVG